MRFVQINYAKPGMRIARNLEDSYGGTLLTAQGTLTQPKIDKLRVMGFAGVYIDDEISKDIEIEDMITQETRARGVECIKNQDIDGCKDIADSIVNEILEKGIITMDISDLRSFDDFTFAHSVNVAVYACIIGIGMGFKSSVLSKLVLAGLLHDIGKVMIPKEVLDKKGRLLPDEYTLIKSHSKYSYEMLEDRKDISDFVKDAILHHHENVDGSGYPDGTEGEEQSIYVKILHVADVYDALISKRPYKEPYSPYEAVEYLMGACDIMFDKTAVNALIQYVPLFPKGTEILLSDGRRALIYENAGFHNLRPIVKLFNGGKIDLSEAEYINIVIKPLDNVEYKTMSEAESERNRMVQLSYKPRILAVDDMLTNLQMLRDILQDKYNLTYVKSGNQALHYLSTNEMPDLILMDIEMPDLDGLDTVRIIRRKYGDIPVLYVTARRDKRTVLECKDMNMSGYIIKPYKATFIKAEINRILSGRGENE